MLALSPSVSSIARLFEPMRNSVTSHGSSGKGRARDRNTYVKSRSFFARFACACQHSLSLSGLIVRTCTMTVRCSISTARCNGGRGSISASRFRFACEKDPVNRSARTLPMGASPRTWACERIGLLMDVSAGVAAAQPRAGIGPCISPSVCAGTGQAHRATSNAERARAFVGPASSAGVHRIGWSWRSFLGGQCRFCSAQ